jgi:hypothetical protein
MADHDKEYLAFPVTEKEAPEAFFPQFMLGLLKRKSRTRSWGTSTITITWKEGWPALVRINEEVTHKFDDPPEQKPVKGK